MGFFDNLGKKASDAYKVTADKTGKLAKEAKLRVKMGDLKSQINDNYKEIGKIVYENHVADGKGNIKKELDEICAKIDSLSEEIKSIEKECLELKDRRKCEKCSSEMEKDAKFCPNCGEEQKVEEVKEEPAKEVEIVEEVKEEKTEKTETKKDDKK